MLNKFIGDIFYSSHAKFYTELHGKYIFFINIIKNLSRNFGKKIFYLNSLKVFISTLDIYIFKCFYYNQCGYYANNVCSMFQTLHFKILK